MPTLPQFIEAYRSLSSLLQKCEKAQEKIPQWTAQYTLLTRRIEALHIAVWLIHNEIEQYNNTQ
jgi:hypothetical protein